jgi:flagella basal body P-ring formation protein FlgA
MRTLRAVTILGLLSVTSYTLAAETVAREVEQAARVQLERQAASAGLVEPEFELAVVAARPAPPCAQPVTVEPLDTRQLTRMRFAVRCPGAGGWKYDYLVRAKLTAMVVVAAVPIGANAPLSDEQVALERRDISMIADPVSAPEQAVGQSSRRSLRTGDILRSSYLASPVLVKRGDQVEMLARHDGIEVSTSGEALDAGGRGAVIRVRNSGSGQVVRMRVTGAGTVESVTGQPSSR